MECGETSTRLQSKMTWAKSRLSKGLNDTSPVTEGDHCRRSTAAHGLIRCEHLRARPEHLRADLVGWRAPAGARPCRRRHAAPLCGATLSQRECILSRRRRTSLLAACIPARHGRVLRVEAATMDSRQERTVRSFENVLIFLDQGLLDSEPPLLKEKRRELSASIKRLEELGTQQWIANPKGRAKARELSRKLRQDTMMPLVRIAKLLLKFAPGAERALRVPHARADMMTVATTALEMAKVLKPHTDLLVSAGFPKTVIADLEASARRVADGARGSASARENRGRLAREVAHELKEAMKTVTVIEGIVMLHSTPMIRKAWKERRRVPRRMGRPKQKRQPKLPS